jgi:hypothetical protein
MPAGQLAICASSSARRQRPVFARWPPSAVQFLSIKITHAISRSDNTTCPRQTYLWPAVDGAASGAGSRSPIAPRARRPAARSVKIKQMSHTGSFGHQDVRSGSPRGSGRRPRARSPGGRKGLAMCKQIKVWLDLWQGLASHRPRTDKRETRSHGLLRAECRLVTCCLKCIFRITRRVIVGRSSDPVGCSNGASRESPSFCPIA